MRQYSTTYACALAMGVLVLLAGCKSTDDTAGTPLTVPEGDAPPSSAIVENEPSAEKRIGLVIRTRRTNPYWLAVEQGARRAQAELGIALVVRSQSNDDGLERQIAMVTELIEEEVDAIVFAPTDSIGLVPIAKKVQMAGILLLTVDTPFDAATAEKWGLNQVPGVSVNNAEGARIAAVHLAETLQKPAKVAILEGHPASQTAKDRKRGAEAGFAAAGGIEIVASAPGNWRIDQGRQVTERIMSEHPEIEGIFCSNDLMALGAIRYLQENGRPDVLVTGYDSIAEARDAIRAGQMLATIDQRPEEQGYRSIKNAVAALAGKSLPLETFVDISLVTAESLQRADK